MISDYDSYSQQEDLKTKLTKHRKMPRLSLFEKTLGVFSPGERLTLYVLTAVLGISALALLGSANALVSVTIPSHGGSLTEGVVGPARFINPLLALSQPDKDLTALVYSGLMRATPEGDLIPDLASQYEISEDGTTYTFTLKSNLTFHDGAPLTSEDVLFTIQRAQNPDVKSSRRADWEGVVAGAPDAQTIVFTLPHAYAPFLENTTLGILPKHLWESVSTEEFAFHPLNTHPVGSGPYRAKAPDTSAAGAVTRYELSSFSRFALGEPYIKKFTFLFFANEEALMSAFNAGRIDSLAGMPPAEVENLTRKDAYIVRAPLPRTFGIFFNQNKNPALADSAVRSALDLAIEKEHIVSEILKGYGAVLDGPIPPGVLGAVQASEPAPLRKGTRESATSSPDGNAEKARAALSRGGWSFDEKEQVWKKKKTALELTLATADEPTLSETAQIVATAWQAAGIKVETHVYPLSELNSVVLRPRNYDAVLFGEVVGRTLDLFAFWHSSQRNDPGLNLALYTNTKADSLLAKARATTNRREREKLYRQFAELVSKDQPAVFLYAPEFIYMVPEGLGGVKLGALTQPSERYLNVYEWYTDTERVWNIFTNKTEE
ncbi:hypothetical protein A3A39_01265 [Candidatus Kaiserbacteria bacterium RIFCSPLOWO2_01_FULL_54_13]|uniref:Solute-binding protein family 5 domain-containing protein n=1 Tax=Candidatus Kaiserbacteria bacterium RIFCSPLOWO2_01_FULL_54_13 TaxID=1798512 RepID=A0A1F6F2C0_9BACT|nr:MAG: hypothetical protein A3A39_01265 [Candidatus Kaiserbacteria bacterium RIFCSPLOWO2_01_FULL_54_13]